MTRTVRPAPRIAARRSLAAWAAVPVLLIAGCTSSGSDDSGRDSGDDQAPPASQQPTPEPVRFADLPNPCTTVGAGLVDRIVPSATDTDGKTLDSSDTSASGTCLWSGLHGYQFRSLTVSLRRFESEVGIGSGDERAERYATRMREEITGDDSLKELKDEQLAEPGEGGAVSLSYVETKKADGDEQRYRQQRVIARTGNVVVTVDYSGAGYEDADMPSAKRVKANAEEAAVEAVAAIEATAGSGNGSDGSNGSGSSDA